MATSSVDDDLHRTPVDAGLGVEDVAPLVLFLVVLEHQNLGDNKRGT